MERIPTCWFTSVSLFLLSSPKVQLEGMTEKFILQTSFKYLLKVFSFYLDTFTYCSMTAISAMFIILHPYSTVLSILILLCIKSLWLVYYLLQVCTLNMYFITPPSLPDNNCLHPPKCFSELQLKKLPFSAYLLENIGHPCYQRACNPAGLRSVFYTPVVNCPGQEA